MELINKVAQSGILTFSLDTFVAAHQVMPFDLKDFLTMGIVLREKDFRAQLKNVDWTIYQQQNVAVFCSVDTLIPRWAYMLVASYLHPIAQSVVVGSVAEAQNRLIQVSLNAHDWSIYQDKNVVVKGCGNQVSEDAYLQATLKLQTVAKKIMYGEPCSAVPIWRSLR